MRNKRHDKILNILLEQENVAIDELATLCKVSSMTIRRDLDFLQKEGMLTRFYGGAKVSKVALQEISYKKKSKENIIAKKNIALAAFKLIEPASSIFLDAGTTTLELAKLLVKEKEHTIITNDLNIASLLANSDNNVYSTGGLIEPTTKSLIGIHSLNTLMKFNLDIVFIAANSISDNMQIETSSEAKALIKEQLIGFGTITALLVDQSKFHKKSLFRVGNLRDIDYIISDYKFTKDDKQGFNMKKLISV